MLEITLDDFSEHHDKHRLLVQCIPNHQLKFARHNQLKYCLSI